jgi:NAD(P)-dependent dehydrogenase (short-subunit alcohol dehydrogenase family)
VAVALQSHGFADLLERVDQIKLIARHNASVVALVAHDKAQVAAQGVRLADDQTRQRRVTAAVQIERDEVASMRLRVLERERVAARDRARKQAQPRRVRHQLAVTEAFGSVQAVDVLVNSAGLDTQIPLAEITPEDMRHLYEVNVIGLLTLTQAALTRMPDRGRIINIGSRAHLGSPNHTTSPPKPP